MNSCREASDVIVMGVKIGAAEVWTAEDDGDGDIFIQCEIFHPEPLKTQAPSAHCISFHFLSGKFKVWDDEGKVRQEGSIFAAIKGTNS